MGNCFLFHKLRNTSLENTQNFYIRGTIPVKILNIYDGDTVTIGFILNGTRYKGLCRIEGIDCAEIKSKNTEEKEFAIQTKEYLTQLILGKIIWATFTKNDKYGRFLAKFKLNKNDKISLDEKLISEGYGYCYNGQKKKIFGEWKRN